MLELVNIYKNKYKKNIGVKNICMGFKKISIWISGPQIVPYQIRQNVFNLKSTLVAIYVLQFEFDQSGKNFDFQRSV